MWKRILSDIFIWIGASIIIILWRLVADKSVIVDYVALFAIMMAAWIVIGLIFQKYTKSYKEYWFWQEVALTILTGAAVMGLCAWQIPQVPYDLSLTVALWTVGIVMMVVSSFKGRGSGPAPDSVTLTVPDGEIKEVPDSKSAAMRGAVSLDKYFAELDEDEKEGEDVSLRMKKKERMLPWFPENLLRKQPLSPAWLNPMKP